MKVSSFARHFEGHLGIFDLMRDLGEAMAAGGSAPVAMLGGGNPAHIPEVEACFAEQMRELMREPARFGRFIGNYSPPKGDPAFIEALAALLRERLQWDVGPEHIVLTAGSQSAFFMLFNIFAGPAEDGAHRRVLLPLLPEYIGYSDLGLAPDMFRAERPAIETLGEHGFRYHVDFDALHVGEDIGAICVSRPGNPTANMLPDAEMRRLHALALQHDLPLIVDGAYGLPFPGIVFGEAQPVWGPNVVLCLSLSKLGLPAVRTGVLIGPPWLVELITRINAVSQLAPGGIGPALTLELVRSGDILRLCHDVVRPCYEARLRQALAWLDEAMQGCPYRVHRPDGGIFLWLWFPGLPCSSHTLYERLRRRGVLVVPGEHFFPGLREPWRHARECIRLTYAQEPEEVRRGIFALADEVRNAYDSCNTPAHRARA